MSDRYMRLREYVVSLIEQMNRIQNAPPSREATVQGLAYHVKESLQNYIDETDEIKEE